MNGLRELDFEGAASRKSRYLKRRLYVNKVSYQDRPRLSIVIKLYTNVGTKPCLAHGWIRQIKSLWSMYPWMY